MNTLKIFWAFVVDFFKEAFKAPVSVPTTPVATPVPTTPVAPPVEPPVKPETPIPTVPPVAYDAFIPSTVNEISYISRAPNSKFPGASQAVMLREYALKDGKPWDAYLHGQVTWPTELLGPGGPGKQKWE
jgi:hypothetical protein